MYCGSLICVTVYGWVCRRLTVGHFDCVHFTAVTILFPIRRRWVFVVMFVLCLSSTD